MRILVVEDNPELMKAAVAAIQAANAEHEVVQATNFLEACDGLLDWPGVDAVITDLFICDGSFVAIKDEPNQPRGLGVVLIAREKKVPCVVCTAGFHHGSKYNWICKIGRELDWPEMVDQPLDLYNFETESQSKDWEKALETLFRLRRK